MTCRKNGKTLRPSIPSIINVEQASLPGKALEHSPFGGQVQDSACSRLRSGAQSFFWHIAKTGLRDLVLRWLSTFWLTLLCLNLYNFLVLREASSEVHLAYSCGW